MRIFVLFTLLFSTLAWSQSPAEYFDLFDKKVYSLKNKGVKDFAVDITNSRLTKQLNDQKTFGTVKKVIFRVHWTAAPERISVDVLGLPEGFVEVKEELKLGILPILDHLLPMTMPQRFAGYSFTPGAKPKEFVAKDTTGLALVPSFVIRFDQQDKLTQVEAQKPVGTSVTDYVYEKKAFSDGRWALTKATTVNAENGQTLKMTRSVDYGTVQGMGVVTSVAITTEQTSSKPNTKPLVLTETVNFENYKIDAGEAVKHFRADGSKSP